MPLLPTCMQQALRNRTMAVSLPGAVIQAIAALMRCQAHTQNVATVPGNSDARRPSLARSAMHCDCGVSASCVAHTDAGVAWFVAYFLLRFFLARVTSQNTTAITPTTRMMKAGDRNELSPMGIS
ncbi:hypothetical protein XCY_002893 [Xanthomonas euroxanthea]|jgi:hypothetical protein|uniref:hypothetical protein n=1 Tax=Xanthomonas euroxanthea TaxID=2259622 RepID=UPI001AFB2E1F|nr:hypothetical protein [Xanthomonas euroxanthea]CAG2093262.1 hypothetical protein XCY_002893 [Xanthomonas euroxanthea]